MQFIYYQRLSQSRSLNAILSHRRLGDSIALPQPLYDCHGCEASGLLDLGSHCALSSARWGERCHLANISMDHTDVSQTQGDLLIALTVCCLYVSMFCCDFGVMANTCWQLYSYCMFTNADYTESHLVRHLFTCESIVRMDVCWRLLWVNLRHVSLAISHRECWNRWLLYGEYVSLRGFSIIDVRDRTLETLHVALFSHAVYYYTILHRGNLPVHEKPIWWASPGSLFRSPSNDEYYMRTGV